MTCEAGNTGEGAPSGAPRPGSVTNAAMRALIEFSKEERLVGAACAHDAFDGILAEHALALEEARDMLREAYGRCLGRDRARQNILKALQMLHQEIDHVRALGSVAVNETEEP